MKVHIALNTPALNPTLNASEGLATFEEDACCPSGCCAE